MLIIQNKIVGTSDKTDLIQTKLINRFFFLEQHATKINKNKPVLLGT